MRYSIRAKGYNGTSVHINTAIDIADAQRNIKYFSAKYPQYEWQIHPIKKGKPAPPRNTKYEL